MTALQGPTEARVTELDTPTGASTRYRLSTLDLATELGTTPKTLRKRAKALGVGINLNGTVGFRFSDQDRQALIDSMRLPPVSGDTETLAETG
jgi:hypothetical protein